MGINQNCIELQVQKWIELYLHRCAHTWQNMWAAYLWWIDKSKEAGWSEWWFETGCCALCMSPPPGGRADGAVPHHRDGDGGGEQGEEGGGAAGWTEENTSRSPLFGPDAVMINHHLNYSRVSRTTNGCRQDGSLLIFPFWLHQKWFTLKNKGYLLFGSLFIYLFIGSHGPKITPLCSHITSVLTLNHTLNDKTALYANT